MSNKKPQKISQILSMIVYNQIDISETFHFKRIQISRINYIPINFNNYPLRFTNNKN